MTGSARSAELLGHPRGLADLILALAAETRGEGLSSWLWLVVYFVLLTHGELCFSPITLSLVSRRRARAPWRWAPGS
ncbi:hypothetical+protein [Methylocapsa aurea]|uniref:hypothetical protein n=1 Tax=Methylocapsa aurea TaxID=663610 RepID=UPI003D18ED74